MVAQQPLTICPKYEIWMKRGINMKNVHITFDIYFAVKNSHMKKLCPIIYIHPCKYIQPRTASEQSTSGYIVALEQTTSCGSMNYDHQVAYGTTDNGKSNCRRDWLMIE